MKVARRQPIKTVDQLQNKILAAREDVRDARKRSRFKRSISIALVGLRKRAGLSQSELATAVGWNKSFVSRLEGAGGALPDLSTIQTYANACKATARLEFGPSSGEEFQAVETVRLSEDDVAALEEAEASISG